MVAGVVVVIVLVAWWVFAIVCVHSRGFAWLAVENVERRRAGGGGAGLEVPVRAAPALPGLVLTCVVVRSLSQSAELCT